jgi:hypothetical protein
MFAAGGWNAGAIRSTVGWVFWVSCFRIKDNAVLCNGCQMTRAGCRVTLLRQETEGIQFWFE